MATIEASATGGLWSATTAWTGGVVPGEADDVILGASSGSITVEAEAKCRSLDATNYKKTLNIKIAAGLKIGAATSSATGLALKLGTEGTVTFTTGPITFVGTSATVQKISTANHNLAGLIKFEATGGKWVLEEAILANEIELILGELNTNAQTVSTNRYFFTKSGTTLVTGNSTFSSSGLSGAECFRIIGAVTGSPIVELIGTNTSVNINNWYKVIVQADSILFREVTLVQILELWTKGKPTGTKFKTPNTFTFEQIISEEKVKLVSETPGKPWKLKTASGTVELRNVEIQDCTAEGGAKFIDRGVGGLDKGNNYGWLFDEDSLKMSPLDLAVADMGSRW